MKGDKGNQMTLRECIFREFEMYAWHSRHQVPTESFFLLNMMHSVSLQLYRSDLGNFLAALACRGDGKVEMVAYPDYSRYVPRDFTEDDTVMFVCADIPEQLKKVEDGASPVMISHRVLDFSFLSCPFNNKSDQSRDPFYYLRNA